MSERAALLAARARLLATLAEITEQAARQALARCPCRALDDRCTFPAGCRNQRRDLDAAALRCSGGGLNPEPVTSA